MTPADFRIKRRQRFLNLEYYELNLVDIEESIENERIGARDSRAKGDLDPVSEGGIFQQHLNLLKLHYTAGCSIEDLKPLYAGVIKALGEWHVAEHEYSKWLAAKSGKDLRLDMTPLHFEDLFHYQLALDVVSLGILLGEGDAVRQAAAWMQSARGTDLLFEALIETAVPDPRDNTDYFHPKPYDPLIDALYAIETPTDASAKVKEYLEGWYKGFEGVPWHNGHLHAVPGEYMPYYGYWSFEAAALCVLHDIDDSSFRDNIVYPKDLADWARAHDSVEQIRPDSPTSGAQRRPASVRGGQPCTQTGWWFTPAQADSRRHFEAGEVMPVIEGSNWGGTFWQWDSSQS